MKIHSDQLTLQLKKKLFPIYLVSGDETLLIEETCDQIRQAAQRKNIMEREIYYVDTRFDWHQFLNALNNFSLFSDQSLIELRLTNHKLNEMGKKTLIDYAQNPPANKILLIVMSKLDSRDQQVIWFQALEKKGIFIQIWPITKEILPSWIQQRLREQDMTADSTAIRFLAEQAEGNLLAAKQEIEKIKLLCPQKHLTLENVMDAVCDHAHYDIFRLVDCALAGDSKRILRILINLKNEGTEPTLILWALAREIRNLISFKEQIDAGKNLELLFKKQAVWEKRKILIRESLKRHTKKSLTDLLQQASLIDRAIKGVTSDNLWDLFNQLSLDFCNTYE